jgi:hypothetical protein
MAVFTFHRPLAYFERMNKTLPFALSVAILVFGGSIGSNAECGTCQTDTAAHGDKSLEKRVASLEKSLKDVGSCDTAGSPYPSKTHDYSKQKECPKEKCSDGAKKK